MPGLTTILFPAEGPDWPTDEYALEKWKIDMLNRIDQEWMCGATVSWDRYTGPVFCDLAEWAPYSGRCPYHTPDGGGWNA